MLTALNLKNMNHLKAKMLLSTFWNLIVVNNSTQIVPLNNNLNAVLNTSLFVELQEWEKQVQLNICVQTMVSNILNMNHT